MVRLPFPDVAAISRFVSDQLISGGDSNEEDGSSSGGSGGVSGGGCHLSPEEHSRNVSTCSLLLLSIQRPLAARLAARQRPAMAAVEGASDQEEAEQAEGPAGPGSSILTLLLPPKQQEGAAASEDEAGYRSSVLSLPLDIAGQHTPPFASNLLPGVWVCEAWSLWIGCAQIASQKFPDHAFDLPSPTGTDEGEPAVTMREWNKRQVDQQRRQAQRAMGTLRGGRGRGRGGGGGRLRIAAPCLVCGWRHACAVGAGWS